MPRVWYVEVILVESRDLICHEFGMLIVILVESHVPRVWYVDSNADTMTVSSHMP